MSSKDPFECLVIHTSFERRVAEAAPVTKSTGEAAWIGWSRAAFM